MTENIIIAIISSITSFITLFLTNKTKKVVEKNNQNTNEALKCMMRNDITNIYYSHKNKKVLRQYERENLDKLVDGYKEMGGNSFVSDIYEQMREWEVEQ